MSILDMALTVLCSAASSEQDLLMISNEFKCQFRPLCYTSAINLDFAVEIDQKLRESNAVDKQQRPSTSTKKIRTAVPAYSICDSTLDEMMFRKLLIKSPHVVKLVDDQISDRLIQCYGKDSRRPDPSTLTSSLAEIS